MGKKMFSILCFKICFPGPMDDIQSYLVVRMQKNQVYSDEADVDQLLTLCILVGSSYWFDTMPLGWSIVYI